MFRVSVQAFRGFGLSMFATAPHAGSLGDVLAEAPERDSSEDLVGHELVLGVGVNGIAVFRVAEVRACVCSPTAVSCESLTQCYCHLVQGRLVWHGTISHSRVISWTVDDGGAVLRMDVTMGRDGDTHTVSLAMDDVRW